MKLFLFTSAAILLGFVSSLCNVYWLSGLSALIALFSAYEQYKDALPYEFIFDASSWQKMEEDFKLIIPKEDHKKAKPIAALFRCKDKRYIQTTTCEVEPDENGSIIVRAISNFEGKIIIK